MKNNKKSNRIKIIVNDAYVYEEELKESLNSC